MTAHAPIVAVPTTYAGSEMTNVYGLTAGGRKRTGRDEAVRPRTVVYDPDLSRDLPPEVAGPSAMNALAHCVDALWAEGATPVSTMLAEGGARALREGLDGDDHERLLYGAALAGWTFGVVGGALHHRICHVLGGAFDLPHAETHSAVLGHVAALNAPAVPGAAARLAAALGADDLAARRVRPRRGARRADRPARARARAGRARRRRRPSQIVAAGNPVPLDERAARELLRRAWAGARSVKTSTAWRFVNVPVPTAGRWEGCGPADNLSAASGNGGAAYRISPPANLRRHPLACTRGSGSGVSRCSISARRGSSCGGRMTTEPSCSSGTSTVKPGPSSAISNSTPLGSRK